MREVAKFRLDLAVLCKVQVSVVDSWDEVQMRWGGATYGKNGTHLSIDLTVHLPSEVITSESPDRTGTSLAASSM